MTMRPLWLAAFILTPCVAQQAATDIAAVKAAYEKLVIANKIELLRDHLSKAGSEEPAPAMSFALSEFRSGPVSEILATTLAELVSKPTGLVLASGVGTWGVNPSDGIAPATTLSAKWRNAGYLSEDWNVPFSLALDNLPPGLDRYVSFAVRLTLDANQRTYRALFLFGSGDTKAVGVDHIVGYSAMNRILAADLSVDPLLHERNGRRPAVRSFLESVRGTPGCQTEPMTKLCCDGGTCRLPPARVPRALVGGGHALLDDIPEMCAPRPADAGADPCSAWNISTPRTPLSAIDTKYHCTGQHSGTVNITTSCTYTSPDPNHPPNSRDGCNVTCHVEPAMTIGEYGLVSSRCHETGQGTSIQNAYAHGLTCSGVGAGGVQACLYCQCALSFSFYGVSLSNTSAFWNVNLGGTYVCN